MSQRGGKRVPAFAATIAGEKVNWEQEGLLEEAWLLTFSAVRLQRAWKRYRVKQK